MWQHARDLIGATIAATDGELGRVDDLYFDDDRWTMRYLVVNTGYWLTGRLVLISPFAIQEVDRKQSLISVALTREQVERSPSFETHRPVSRQHEVTYAAYYGYPVYWGGPDLWGAAGYPTLAGLAAPEASVVAPGSEASPEDSHLRSVREVKGYAILATNGEIGYVQDFVVDTRSWAIRLLIVDTSHWWTGKRVLLSPDWIRDIRWDDRTVEVDLSRDAVKDSPEWDKRAPIDEQFERKLAGHYGREYKADRGPRRREK
jgi:sporulation protein YlmC with PRC-barrel domain